MITTRRTLWILGVVLAIAVVARFEPTLRSSPIAIPDRTLSEPVEPVAIEASRAGAPSTAVAAPVARTASMIPATDAVADAEATYQARYGANSPIPFDPYFHDGWDNAAELAAAFDALWADFEAGHVMLLELMRFCPRSERRLAEEPESLDETGRMIVEGALLACAEFESPGQPFFEFERRAERGDRAKRLIYLAWLDIAIDLGVVNPRTDPGGYDARRANGMRWLRELSAGGSGTAAATLSHEYERERFVEADSVLAAYYAIQAEKNGFEPEFARHQIDFTQARLNRFQRERLDRLLERDEG